MADTARAKPQANGTSPSATAPADGAVGVSAAPDPKGPKTFPKVDANAVRHAFETGAYPYSRKIARGAV